MDNQEVGADRALVASDQAASRLAPSGFDHGDRDLLARLRDEERLADLRACNRHLVASDMVEAAAVIDDLTRERNTARRYADHAFGCATRTSFEEDCDCGFFTRS
jgi:hypothetical protein